MIFVECDCKGAAFHFSVEEFFTRHVKNEEPVLMLWQADKTVMLGNNQVADAEVNTEFAGKSGIVIIRRSSGGGAIYTDLGTVLFTFITPLIYEPVIHRENAAVRIIKALASMGVNASREGKNDILLDGKKISGLAQYTVDNHICTHGSLLYNTDLETLTNVLIANESKLAPKGITSIRSRVTNIKPYMNTQLTTGEFIGKLKDILLSDNDYSIFLPTSDEIDKINKIAAEKYENRMWNYRM